MEDDKPARRTPEEVEKAAARFREDWFNGRRARRILAVDALYRAYLSRFEVGERAAYIAALKAATSALMSCSEECDEGSLAGKCFAWFEDLGQQLADLNHGIVSPALDCPVRSKALTTAEWEARSVVVNTVELLHSSGMKYRSAARRVIDGFQLPPDTSEKEVLSWCAEFKKGRVKNKLAMKYYVDCQNMLGEASSGELQLWAGKMLHEFDNPNPDDRLDDPWFWEAPFPKK